VSEPRYQRRKEDRPQEITEAALQAFAKKGYAATRVDDVAKRAGVSKGLLYLYFKTKEELFKSVVRSFVVPRIETLSRIIESSDMSSEEFLRGPFLDFARQLPGSPVGVIVRLMIAEGPKHPDLVQFYWDNVVSRGMAMITELLQRGVRSG
jgi:AcrR family transcriptional regulator